MQFIIDFILLLGFALYSAVLSFLGYFITTHPERDMQGETVLITGAGGGLGSLMARNFAKRGCKLVLWDIADLTPLVEELQKEYNTTAFQFKVDLRSKESIYKTATEVQKVAGDVDILINNAGIVSGKSLLECTDQQIEMTFQVNSLALFWTTRAFLPAMKQKNHGQIVTIASAAGQNGTPKLVDYCSSKFAAVGFDEALRRELAKEKINVKTTCICPFYINTGMFLGAQSKFPSLLPILEPKYVSDRICQTVASGQPLLILPWFVSLAVLVKAVLPTVAADAAIDYYGVTESMDNFIGRKKEQ